MGDAMIFLRRTSAFQSEHSQPLQFLPSDRQIHHSSHNPDMRTPVTRQFPTLDSVVHQDSDMSDLPKEDASVVKSPPLSDTSKPAACASSPRRRYKPALQDKQIDNDRVVHLYSLRVQGAFLSSSRRRSPARRTTPS